MNVRRIGRGVIYCNCPTNLYVIQSTQLQNFASSGKRLLSRNIALSRRHGNQFSQSLLDQADQPQQRKNIVATGIGI